MELGKVGYRRLSKLLSVKGAGLAETVVRPGIGIDAGAFKSSKPYVVAHCDPITASKGNVGWLAINVAANDVAALGGDPKWFLLDVLIPPHCCVDDFISRLASEVDTALREIRGDLLGGHTEVTDAVTRPLVSCTCIGVAERLTPASNAKHGDVVVVTKAVGLEGTAILCEDYGDVLESLGVPKDVIERGKSFIKEISVVKEAKVLRNYANAMHDVTEGGLIGALTEVAAAAKVDIVVYEDAVPLREETREVCSKLSIDPLRLIGSGALIATIPRDALSEVSRELEREGIEYAVIGGVAGLGGRVYVRGEKFRIYTEPQVKDEIYKAIEKLEKIKARVRQG